jgi:hypothetical protein
MKPAWFAAFALPILCTSLTYPQATPPTPPATNNSTIAKAVATPDVPAAGADTAAAPMSKEATEIAPKTAGMVQEVGEAELKERLTGRPLFLRGLWLGETLHFNMNGELVGQSAKGSFTLCGVFVDHVRVTKKEVELEGVRFGIHFEGEAPWGEQSTSFDRIQITPKKKHQEIVIDRQLVVVPKKKKEKETAKGKNPMSQNQGHGAPAPESSDETAANAGARDGSATAAAAAPRAGASAAPGTTVAMANGKELPPGATTSPAESAEHLRVALNKIFAPELDGKMISEMPDYWQFFYQAQQSHKWLEPTDQTLVHPGPGVDGPKLLKNVVPASNDYAQHGEVAGVASYKVILDPQGKILAVAVYRPIGFGLDENAVAALEKSTFAPAVKDGKPVASVIDVAVNFRIYSKRTAAGSPDTVAGDPSVSPVTGKAALPGIYSAQAAAGAPAQNQPQQ